MKTKFTPGPWQYDKQNSNIVSLNHFVNPEEEAEYRINTTVVSLYGAMGGDDTEADAKLIAAAPDLLDALKYLLASYKDDFKNITGSELNDTVAVKKAKEAIKKALD